MQVVKKKKKKKGCKLHSIIKGPSLSSHKIKDGKSVVRLILLLRKWSRLPLESLWSADEWAHLAVLGLPWGLAGVAALAGPALGPVTLAYQAKLHQIPLFTLGNLIGQVLPDCRVPRHCLQAIALVPRCLGCSCALACLLCALTQPFIWRDAAGCGRRLPLNHCPF